jgi:hypothetical protein
LGTGWGGGGGVGLDIFKEDSQHVYLERSCFEIARLGGLFFQLSAEPTLLKLRQARRLLHMKVKFICERPMFRIWAEYRQAKKGPNKEKNRRIVRLR